MTPSPHETHMRRAFELARRAEGRTSPNPMVGAVLAREGRVIGEGWHQRAGEAHAEIHALRQAGEMARGATLYVTLEPCGVFGRTPPCSDALLAAGIAEVWYGTLDPNPKTCGKGHAQLEAAGVRVHAGLCEPDARELIRPFAKHVATGRPWVTAKFAMSLDGKIATREGDSRWISNEASRERVHRLRNVTDALLVGVDTIVQDNPRLTTRLPEGGGHHPLRVIADSRLRSPLASRVFDPDLPGKSVLATTPAANRDDCARLRDLGVEVWELPANPRGRVDLGALLDEMGRRGILTLMVEGGGELHGALFAERLVDRVWAFVAPRIIGGREARGPVAGEGFATLAEALHLENMVVEMLSPETPGGAPNLWIRAEVRPTEER